MDEWSKQQQQRTFLLFRRISTLQRKHTQTHIHFMRLLLVIVMRLDTLFILTHNSIFRSILHSNNIFNIGILLGILESIEKYLKRTRHPHACTNWKSIRNENTWMVLNVGLNFLRNGKLLCFRWLNRLIEWNAQDENESPFLTSLKLFFIIINLFAIVVQTYGTSFQKNTFLSHESTYWICSHCCSLYEI